MHAVAFRHVSKRYGQEVWAVRSVDLDVRPGELVALIGPSGCGKTTLLRVAAGLERPDTGRVEIGGLPVAGEGAWLPPERRRIGMVFQDYALFPHLDVAGNVGFGVDGRGRASRVAEVLALVGLAGLGGRAVQELSGGQQQRVALARALAPRPSILLLDEPWSNIDPLLRRAMREELSSILREAGVAVVLVTHDQEEALSVADRVVVMCDGRVVQDGSAEDVYHAPATRWVAEFVGRANVLEATPAGDGTVVTSLGTVEAVGAVAGPALAIVRPEVVELERDPLAAARVVWREFRGHDCRYRVRLPDGAVVEAQRPSTERIALGARVHVRLGGVPVPLVPDDRGVRAAPAPAAEPLRQPALR